MRSEKSAALALALSQKSCARAQSEKLRSRSRSIFLRPCTRSRAENVLSAAQFCAHFEILNQCQYTLKDNDIGRIQAF